MSISLQLIPRRRPNPRVLIAGLITAIFIAAFAIAPVDSASAAPTGLVKVTTQRMSGPSLETTQVGWYNASSNLSLSCYLRGQSVKGYFSPYIGNGGWDNLWYKVSDGYFVADVDIDTGSNAPVTGQCSTATPTPSAPSGPTAKAMARTQRMSEARLTSTQNGWYESGATVTLSCYTYGQAVKGYFSAYVGNGGWDSLWYQASDGFYLADVDIDTGSNSPVAKSCSVGTDVSTPPSTSGSNTIISRAKSWVDAHVPYNQGASFANQYGKYRTDCSGFVSMAWGLGSSYVTWTLPQVSHPITKDQLTAGDILLNNTNTNAHVVIFSSWANAAKTQYWVYESNPDGAVYHQIPYPYWPSAGGTYLPYRQN